MDRNTILDALVSVDDGKVQNMSELADHLWTQIEDHFKQENASLKAQLDTREADTVMLEWAIVTLEGSIFAQTGVNKRITKDDIRKAMKEAE